MTTDTAPKQVDSTTAPSPPFTPAIPAGDSGLRAGRTPEQVVGTARQRQRTTVATRPTPLPKRPKGRWLVGLILCAIIAMIVHGVWDTFLRYSAYGLVQGRVIQVSSPWPGVVKAVHVREGDHVIQDATLVSLEDLQLKHQLDRIGDDLKIAQATLRSEIAQLEYQSKLQGDRTKKALAEYFELWGQLLQERSKLDELQGKLARSKGLSRRDVITEEELESLSFLTAGQKAKVGKLEEAVREMKERVSLNQQFDVTGQRQFEPQIARIEALQADLTRLRKNMQQGRVLSPTAGRVLTIEHFAGESIGATHVLLELLEENSLQGILYLPQYKADALQVGQEIRLRAAPLDDLVKFRVARIGEKLVPAPANLARYYREFELLLPVYLEPGDPAAAEHIRLGSELRLPYDLSMRSLWVAFSSFFYSKE